MQQALPTFKIGRVNKVHTLEIISKIKLKDQKLKREVHPKLGKIFRSAN
jgi:hypothetical protein